MQDIVVYIIVGFAACYSIWRVVRLLCGADNSRKSDDSGRSNGDDCGGCNGCNGCGC